MTTQRTFTAFAGDKLISTGDIESTLAQAKSYLDMGHENSVLVFDDSTGAQLDFDWRGSLEDVVERLGTHPMFQTTNVEQTTPRSGPGRPKLGVVSREVSLLPRHWEWLEAQSGGISATLRRLVDETRKARASAERTTRARDAMSRFMWAVTGNLPGFEEATRALFANDLGRFEEHIRDWPVDIRSHLQRLSASAFSQKTESPALS